MYVSGSHMLHIIFKGYSTGIVMKASVCMLCREVRSAVQVKTTKTN